MGRELGVGARGAGVGAEVKIFCLCIQYNGGWDVKYAVTVKKPKV
jgi:hypothetical protein